MLMKKLALVRQHLRPSPRIRVARVAFSLHAAAGLSLGTLQTAAVAATAAAAEPTKESRMKGALFGTLVADALTLGTH